MPATSDGGRQAAADSTHAKASEARCRRARGRRGHALAPPPPASLLPALLQRAHGGMWAVRARVHVPERDERVGLEEGGARVEPRGRDLAPARGGKVVGGGLGVALHAERVRRVAPKVRHPPTRHGVEHAVLVRVPSACATTVGDAAHAAARRQASDQHAEQHQIMACCARMSIPMCVCVCVCVCADMRQARRGVCCHGVAPRLPPARAPKPNRKAARAQLVWQVAGRATQSRTRRWRRRRCAC